MQSSFIKRIWQSKLKHLQGEHNQKKHGARGGSKLSQRADNTTPSAGDNLTLGKYITRSYGMGKFSDDEVKIVKKMMNKFSSSFGFDPKITIHPGSDNLLLAISDKKYGNSFSSDFVSISKNADNSFTMIVQIDALRNKIASLEKSGWNESALNSLGIATKNVKMTPDKVMNHVLGSAIGSAMVTDISDFASAIWDKFPNGRPTSYAGVGTELNPVLKKWGELFRNDGVGQEIYPNMQIPKTGGSSYWNAYSKLGLADMLSSFANSAYIPPKARAFILENFYAKAKKEFRYKHLQGTHNQKKHGNRGAKISLEVISGLDSKTQSFYTGLSTKDQVKFRLAWYREKAKNPNADPAAFAKTFKPGAAASPKTPKTPKAPKAVQPAPAPAPAPAPVVQQKPKAANLQEPKDGLYINKNLHKTIAPEVEKGLNAISSVHKIPDNATKIWVRHSDSMSYNGSFESTVLKNGTLDPDGIYISKFSNITQRQGVFCHEYGHYLKDEINRTFSTPAVQKALANVEDAIKQTKAYQRLNTNLKTGIDPMIKGADGNQYRLSNKTLDYMISKHETFARAYAQYIAFKTGDKSLIDSVYGSWDNGHVMVAQWSKNDFAGVEKAFDNLFSELGW